MPKALRHFLLHVQFHALVLCLLYSIFTVDNFLDSSGILPVIAIVLSKCCQCFSDAYISLRSKYSLAPNILPSQPSGRYWFWTIKYTHFFRNLNAYSASENFKVTKNEFSTFAKSSIYSITTEIYFINVVYIVRVVNLSFITRETLLSTCRNYNPRF